MNMSFEDIIAEYGLEIDDFRWYLAEDMCKNLLALKDDPLELTRRIWKGSLADQLHDMEESYLRSLKADYESEYTDEQRLREICREVLHSRNKRTYR